MATLRASWPVIFWTKDVESIDRLEATLPLFRYLLDAAGGPVWPFARRSCLGGIGAVRARIDTGQIPVRYRSDTNEIPFYESSLRRLEGQRA